MYFKRWILDKVCFPFPLVVVPDVNSRRAAEYAYNFICNQESADDVADKTGGGNDCGKSGNHDQKGRMFDITGSAAFRAVRKIEKGQWSN